MTTRMTVIQRMNNIEKLQEQRDIIREAQRTIARATRRRNLYVIKLLDGGLTEREVGEHAGVTGPRAHQIYHGKPATSTKPKRKARR